MCQGDIFLVERLIELAEPYDGTPHDDLPEHIANGIHDVLREVTPATYFKLLLGACTRIDVTALRLQSFTPAARYAGRISTKKCK